MPAYALFQNRIVEVLDVFQGSGRKMAKVHYVDNTPVAHYSHGGWCYDFEDTIPLGLLKQFPEECTCNGLEAEACPVCKARMESLYPDELPFTR